MKKLIIRLIVVAVVAGAAWGGYTLVRAIPQTRQATMPTTKVRKGDVIVRSYARGELRAVRSSTLTAPNLFGTVQVTRLAPLGALAKEKDLVVEFDDSELQSRIEEKQLELDQIDEQIKKAQADLAIRNNQDEVELLRARYSVRRSELEVKRNELLSAIDAKKNLLNLEEARRRLKQLESDVKSRREQAEAELAVLRERRNKAVLEMNREKMRLQQVKVLSPMAGLVAIRQTRPAFFMPGVQLPDIREGDQLQPGMPVADILDLSEMEVLARVGELDRANLKEGQEVFITLDALADKRLKGTIKSMSGTASANIFSSDPAKKFDVVFSVDMEKLLSALGATKEQIARVMAQAEANRKRAPVGGGPGAMLAGMMPAGGDGGFGGAGGGGAGGPGGAGGLVMFGGGAGGPGGAGGGPPGGMVQFRSGGPAGAGAAGGPGAGLTDEQRTKMRDAMQKALNGKSMQDLTPEERTAVFAKVQEELKKQGITLPGRPGGERKGGEAKAGEGKGGGEARKGGEQVAGGEGRGEGRRGGRQGGPGGTPAGMGFGGAQQYNEKEMANAKLPPPPEEDSQLDVLLRPGLLADVEIIVEKIPNAVHIPAQAVFQRDGKMIVFVKENGKFVPREIKLSKRSESTMVISSGVNPGDEIALADPDAKPGEKGKKAVPSGGGAVGTMPGGKKG